MTHIRGLYGGVLSDLAIGPKGIQGNAGRCSYSLDRKADEYTGFSACGGLQHPADVHLPKGLASKPGAEQAALIAVLLGR